MTNLNNTISRRQSMIRLGSTALAVAGATSPGALWDQASDKPVKFILPVSAGSGVDGMRAPHKTP